MQQNTVNPDTVCQQAIQAKLNTYQAREHFETYLKAQNDSIDALVTTIGLMKARILELEAEIRNQRNTNVPEVREELQPV